MSTQQTIETRLTERFSPVHLEIVDDSARHAGHPGAAGGGGHFLVTLVSADFEGMPRVQRHRAVYQELDGLMGGAIHALGLKTWTPAEWESR
ncbi:hypothetical protein ABI59_05125 [Acidobacteria bacterium Mor1]|nr:hypothetical protein ABI59_05125 [Acidobacteria bacterium Mor1]